MLHLVQREQEGEAATLYDGCDLIEKLIMIFAELNGCFLQATISLPRAWFPPSHLLPPFPSRRLTEERDVCTTSFLPLRLVLVGEEPAASSLAPVAGFRVLCHHDPQFLDLMFRASSSHECAMTHFAHEQH